MTAIAPQTSQVCLSICFNSQSKMVAGAGFDTCELGLADTNTPSNLLQGEEKWGRVSSLHHPAMYMDYPVGLSRFLGLF